MLLEPVVGVMLAGILLGEAMGPTQAFGGALVLAGALVLQLRSDPQLEATVETAAGPVV
jgi:drug/metabolite transporter (DMT)-like permease